MAPRLPGLLALFALAPQSTDGKRRLILAMKRCISVTTAIALLCGTAFVSPLLQARTCSGNGDVLGSYGFTASRAGFFLLGATPPGSNATLGSGPIVPVAVTPQGTT